MTRPRRVVFLDRDGVVTVPVDVDGKGYAVRTVADLEFYPDAEDSVRRLRDAGYDVVIVTNQPDVSTGDLDPATLEAIHDQVAARLAVTGIRTCPHGEADSCSCRKPLPGLLTDEARVSPVAFDASWLVGDRDSDISAGLAMGCRTVFIHRGWTAETGQAAEVMVSTLTEAVDTILSP